VTPRGGVKRISRLSRPGPGLSSLDGGYALYLERGGESSLSRLAGGGGDLLPRLPVGDTSRPRFNGRGERSRGLRTGERVLYGSVSLWKREGGGGL
jgi:hypothetical protein